WYFAQVLTCALLFVAIDEMLGRRRPLLLGGLFALLLATRFPAALGVAWPAGAILLSDEPLRQRLRALAALALPCVVMAALLMLYNQLRFDSPFEPGYRYQLLPSHAEAARALGVFSIVHLPTNLYYLLLAAPRAVLRDGGS